MALPITNVSQTFLIPPTGDQTSVIVKIGQRQKKPYDLVTPAYRHHKRLDSLHYGTNPGMQNGFSSHSGGQPWVLGDEAVATGDPNWSKIRDAHLDAYNSAFGKLQSRALSDTAGLGATIGELRETANSFEKRVLQLYRGFKALKKLRFYDVAYEFGLIRNKRPKKRRVGRTGKLYWARHPVTKKFYPVPRKRTDGRYVVQSFSGLVLEYNFGWAPTVGEVQDIIAVMQRDPYHEVKVRGNGKQVISFTSDYGTSSYIYYHSHTIAFKSNAGATYRVSNPNHDLAHRLGLDNLALVALELTPFSFVANWFLNLEEWTGNLSSTFRNQLHDTWHSTKCESKHDYRIWSNLPPRWDHWSVASGNSYQRWTGSLPPVALRVRQRFMPNFTRAANASALLVVLFSKKG